MIKVGDVALGSISLNVRLVQSRTMKNSESCAHTSETLEREKQLQQLLGLGVYM